jgi:hypothetical protein
MRGPFEAAHDSPDPVRGPFEPLHRAAEEAALSGQPQVDAARPKGSQQQAGDGQPQAAQGQSEPPGQPDDERAGQHARKLEQIKDLYMTAEAIGEANVDKHFDRLLAQQRDLIGDYIKQSKAALHDDEKTADPTAT